MARIGTVVTGNREIIWQKEMRATLITAFITGVLAAALITTTHILFKKGILKSQNAPLLVKLSYVLGSLLFAIPTFTVGRKLICCSRTEAPPPWKELVPNLETLTLDEQQELKDFLNHEHWLVEDVTTKEHQLLERIFDLPQPEDQLRIMQLCIDAGFDFSDLDPSQPPPLIRVLEKNPCNIALLTRILSFYREKETSSVIHDTYENVTLVTRALNMKSPNKVEALILIAKEKPKISTEEASKILGFLPEDAKSIFIELMELKENQVEILIATMGDFDFLVPPSQDAIQIQFKTLDWVLERIDMASLSGEDTVEVGQAVSLLRQSSDHRIILYWEQICRKYPRLYELGLEYAKKSPQLDEVKKKELVTWYEKLKEPESGGAQ